MLLYCMLYTLLPHTTPLIEANQIPYHGISVSLALRHGLFAPGLL